METVVADFDADHLVTLSHDRRVASLAILGDLSVWLSLASLLRPSRRRRWRVPRRARRSRLRASDCPQVARMVLGFYSWCWRAGLVSADTLLMLRAVPSPIVSGARAEPRPYRPGELRDLRRVLDARWPKLRPVEAARSVARWRDGRSPYSRIPSHAIRAQLDALIALAFNCGLRRDEIFQIDIEAIHPDNAYIVVSHRGGRWHEMQRVVPYIDSARVAIAPWVRLRASIGPDDAATWLNLWSAAEGRASAARVLVSRRRDRPAGPRSASASVALPCFSLVSSATCRYPLNCLQ
jgi:integrase